MHIHGMVDHSRYDHYESRYFSRFNYRMSSDHRKDHKICASRSFYLFFAKDWSSRNVTCWQYLSSEISKENFIS